MKSIPSGVRLAQLIVAACAVTVSARAQDLTPVLSEQSVRQVVAAEQQFSQSLFARLAERNQEGNPVIAPFGVFESLAMLDVGARGNSSTLIRRVTGLPGSGGAVSPAIVSLHASGAALVGSLDATLRDNNGYGVAITKAPHEGSFSARARLDEGDLIFSVDGAVVRSAAELQSLFRTAGDSAVLSGYDFSLGHVFLNRRVGVAKARASDDDPANRQVMFASLLWLRSDAAAGSLFPTMLQDLYDVPTLTGESLNRVATQQAVNDAFRETTRGRLSRVPLPNDVDPRTAMLLMNTITMDARWQHPFPVEATKVAAFSTGEDSSIAVPYMRQRGVFRYAEMGEVQVLELPYRESDLVMRISLAKDDPAQDLFERAAFLNPIDAHRLSELLTLTQIDLALPKFRADFATSLRPLLEDLQLGELFTDDADFSGVSPHLPIRLDDLLQSTFVEINEEGTRAGAVTTSVGIPKSEAGTRIIRFHATHSFHFEIRDGHGTVLFAGRINRPTVAGTKTPQSS